MSLRYEETNDNYFSDEVLEFINDINKRKDYDLLLKFNYYNNNFFKDKVTAIAFIKDLLRYYEVMLNKNDNNNLEEIVLVVSILADALNKLKYNVNMKLWIDNLLISLMEV